MWCRRTRKKCEERAASAGIRFLNGEAVDLFDESRLGVPAWARVNTLAHASPEQLTTHLGRDVFRLKNRWNAAVAYLVVELRSISRRKPEAITLIQRSVLVPLELGLLAGEIREPTTPGELVTLVMNAIRRAHVRDLYG